MNICRAFVAIALFFGLNAVASSINEGENLLQPMPLPGAGWTAQQGHRGEDEEVTRWLSASHEGLVATILRKEAGGFPASRYMAESNDEGQSTCEDHSVETLNESPVHGYERAIWKEQCTREGGVPELLLHLYITGEESGYYLLRRWNSIPDSEELNTWVDYFKSVSVCDTRSDGEAACR